MKPVTCQYTLRLSAGKSFYRSGRNNLVCSSSVHKLIGEIPRAVKIRATSRKTRGWMTARLYAYGPVIFINYNEAKELQAGILTRLAWIIQRKFGRDKVFYFKITKTK